MLEDVKVDPSTKTYLFDALDFECRGELDVNTIVAGIMNLRGPITKLDIVATRLKIMHIMRLTMDICRKLGIPIDSNGWFSPPALTPVPDGTGTTTVRRRCHP